MSTGAGIAAAAGIGAAGSLLAGDEQSDAARKASDTQLEMYERTRADLAPYRDVGYAALDVLAGMFIPGYGATSDIDSQIASLERELESATRAPSAPAMPGIRDSSERRDLRKAGRGGARYTLGSIDSQGGFHLGGGAAGGMDTARIDDLRGRLDALRAQRSDVRASPSQAPGYSAFYKSPGYEFRLEEGTRALDRSAASRGRLRSGAHERELIRYGQGVASSEFNSYANRLASLAGLGQTSTAQTGSFGAAAAGAAGQYLQNQGTARASGYAGAANALNAGIGNYLFYAGLQNQEVP